MEQLIVDNTFNETYLNSYLETAEERHRIYLKKTDGQPRPWTEDPVYQKFFFCNLFRQYDKCSKWIIDNIVPYERWDLIILYRFISTFELFEEIKKNCNLENLNQIHEFMAEWKASGRTMFNGCFLRNPRIEGNRWVETYKVPFHTIESIRRDLAGLREALSYNSLEYMVTYLKNFPGIGGFMGYEYACDFEYTKFFNPTDKYTWANMGPGAKRGMSIMRFGVPGRPMSQKEWIVYALELYGILKKRIETVFPQEDVTMREVEHWLCEYQKYVKYWGVLNYNQKVKYRTYEPED